MFNLTCSNLSLIIHYHKSYSLDSKLQKYLLFQRRANNIVKHDMVYPGRYDAVI